MLLNNINSNESSQTKVSLLFKGRYKWLFAQCLYDSGFTLCFGSLLYSYAKTILQDVVLLAEHKHKEI